MYQIDLEGKTALVTGGADGLMRECALGLADAGADICIGDIDVDGAEGTAAEIRAKGRQALACRCDVSKGTDMEELFAQANRLAGHIDIVMNGAGIVYMATVEEADEEQVRREFDINVMGVEFGSKLALRYMKKQKSGAVINLSSVAARGGTVPHPHYAMTKAAILNLTQSYAKYAAPYGIRYNSLLPGIVYTSIWQTILGGIDETFEEHVKKAIPMGVPQEPVDIANAAVFLASDKARFITGQALNVDGGLIML